MREDKPDVKDFTDSALVEGGFEQIGPGMWKRVERKIPLIPVVEQKPVKHLTLFQKVTSYFKKK